MTLRDVVERFGMERHHLAGWYSVHYSDSELLGRPRVSSIYYLLAGDEPMPLHKRDAVEVWHHYQGAAAEFTVTNGSRMRETCVLGGDFVAGERPQLAVPAYLWQSCRSLGDWTLLGCTMTPGWRSGDATLIDGED